MVGGLFVIFCELEVVWNVYMGQGNECCVGVVLNSDWFELQIIWYMNCYYQWCVSCSWCLYDGWLKLLGGVDFYMVIIDGEWNEDVDVVCWVNGGILMWIILEQYKVIDVVMWVIGNWFGGIDLVVCVMFDWFFDYYVYDLIVGFKKQMEDGYVGFVEVSCWLVNCQYFMGKCGKKFLYWCYEGDKVEQVVM